MLQVKLTDCTNCINLLELLCQIDERLAYYASNEYHRITLLLNINTDPEAIGDLLHYKRIVTNRLFYPSYAQEVPLANIVSRIKILLYK